MVTFDKTRNGRILIEQKAELKTLDEEKRSALDDDALLMNIIHQIKRLTEEKGKSFIVGEN